MADADRVVYAISSIDAAGIVRRREAHGGGGVLSQVRQSRMSIVVISFRTDQSFTRPAGSAAREAGSSNHAHAVGLACLPCLLYI